MSGGTASGTFPITAYATLPDGQNLSFTFDLAVGCNNPTLTTGSITAVHNWNLGQSSQYEVPTFTADQTCTISFSVSSISPDDGWLVKLPSGRGVSWDTSDLDTNKVGTHVVTVTASAGCTTKDASFNIIISSPCDNDAL